MPIKVDEETLNKLAQGAPTPDPNTLVVPEETVPPAVTPPTEGNLPDITLDIPKADTKGTPADLNTQVDDKLKEAGFNLAELETKIKKDGKISDELVAKIKEKVDPAFVDAHLGRIKAELELAQIKAQESEAKVQEMNKYIFESVKGEANFKAMAQYLKANIPAEEINALNELLGSGDKAKVNLALQQAVTKYNTLKGRGKLMEGDTNLQAPTIEPMSKDEYQKICSSEKYKEDATYRKQVDARRLRTLTDDKQKFPPGMYWTRDSSGLRRI